MFGMLQPYDWQETRRTALEEGREEGQEKMLKELFLDGDITPDTLRKRLVANLGHLEKEAASICKEWEEELRRTRGSSLPQ